MRGVVFLWKLREEGQGGGGGGVGTGNGTGKSMRMRLSNLPFRKLPFSFSPIEPNVSCGCPLQVSFPQDQFSTPNPQVR